MIGMRGGGASCLSPRLAFAEGKVSGFVIGPKQWASILGPRRFVEAATEGVPMQVGEQYHACVDGLAAFMEGVGFSDAVIGLSGGIDSSLVAVMAVDALCAEHVHGVLLPGPYSSKHSVTDAQELADNLGTSVQTVSICEPFESFERVLARACGGKLKGLAAENAQARCRMVCLMALSNTYGWMVLNTGNKSESMMGYSTLYGDMVGAFAPLGGLYKTDVYALARWRNDEAARQGRPAPIPENVLAKAPSAELSPDQSDETSLGVDYPTLDRLLRRHVEEGAARDDLVTEGFPEELVDRILATVQATAFKRALEPPSAEVILYR